MCQVIKSYILVYKVIEFSLKSLNVNQNVDRLTENED